MPSTFLSVGHFCYDVTPGGHIIGGSAAYATMTARNLGSRARAVTSVGPDFERQNALLKDIETHYHQARETTIFENQYDEHGNRQQSIAGLAMNLGPEHIPPEWRRPDIVYLCPISGEVDADVIHAFSDETLIGLTPQGWMRQWDDDGRVFPKRWENAEDILPHTHILILSDEDLGIYPDELEKYIKLTPIVVLTRGARDAQLFENGNVIKFPAYPINEIDPTGAGDVFATAFLINYCRTRSVEHALNFAHCVASFAVEGIGTSNIPTFKQVMSRLKSI